MPGELGELAFRLTEFYASFRRPVGHAVFSDTGKPWASAAFEVSNYSSLWGCEDWHLGQSGALNAR